jgi:hypothetical protein
MKKHYKDALTERLETESVREVVKRASFSAREIRDMKLDDIPFLIKPWLVRGFYHVLVGAPGSMKSYLSLWLMKQAAEKVPVLYVDLENPKQIVKQRFESLDISPECELMYWADWVETGDDYRPPPNLHEVYAAAAGEFKGVVCLDSMNRFHRLDENAATEMSKFTDFAMTLRKRGATVWVIHQCGKPRDDGSVSYRGSSEIEAGVDILIKIAKLENKGNDRYPQNILTVDIEKARAFPIFSTVLLFDSRHGEFHAMHTHGLPFSMQYRAAEKLHKLIAIRDTIADLQAKNVTTDKAHVHAELVARGLSAGLSITTMRETCQKWDKTIWYNEIGAKGRRLWYLTEDGEDGYLPVKQMSESLLNTS